MGGLLPPDLSPEESLLLRCARIHFDGDPLPLEQVDWDRFLELAGRHALVPSAFRHLVEGGSGDLPAPAAEALNSAYERSVRRSFLLVARLVKLLGVFEEASIPAIVFKGPAQALCLEWGPGARQFVDVDLLLRKEDAPRARDLLVSRGYRRERDLRPPAERAQLRTQCDYKLFGPTPGEAVELHWDFFPRYFSVEFPLEEIWDRSEFVELAGRPVRVLAPGDDLLVACAHGAKHHWERLGWIRDLAGALCFRPPRDWQRVAEAARALGISRILTSALHIAREALGAGAACHLRPDRGARDYAGQVLRRLFSSPGCTLGSLDAMRLLLLARERPSDRTHLLSRLALTTTQRDWDSFPLPDRLFALCPLWRPARLALDLVRGSGRQPE